MTELLIVHAGALSPWGWTRLTSLLPAGTPMRIEELERSTPFWAAADGLTTRALAAGLRAGADTVVVGWGVGGAVADALAARTPVRRVLIFDGLAPGAPEPDEPELLRRFAMYLGARRGRALAVQPERLQDGAEAALAHLAAVAGTAHAALRRGFGEHVRRERRDHGLIAEHAPSGAPLTVVKAADSLLPHSRTLGWERFGEVELLRSAGDHYSMLADPHLALVLARWLAPAYCAA